MHSERRFLLYLSGLSLITFSLGIDEDLPFSASSEQRQKETDRLCAFSLIVSRKAGIVL